jgi:hypothetical protein
MGCYVYQDEIRGKEKLGTADFILGGSVGYKEREK